MPDTITKFRVLLRRQRRQWLGGATANHLVQAIQVFLLVMALLVFLDVQFAFFPETRVRLLCLGLAIPLGMMFYHVLRAFFYCSLHRTAREIDGLLEDPRSNVLTAHELILDSNLGSDESTTSYLIGIVVHRAQKALTSCPVFALWNRKQFWERLGILLIIATGVVSGMLWGGPAAFTALNRYLTPYRDIPPHSDYLFIVTPSRVTVPFGDSVEISVEIAGSKVDSGVTMLTRVAGQRHETGCFQQEQNVFVQRLEQVVKPAEFCFRVGRARSKWRSVHLQMRPMITGVNAKVEPPAYARKPEWNGPVPQRGLDVLRGSRVTLSISSNRPLKDGFLKLLPDAVGADPKTLSELAVTDSEVNITWQAFESASASLGISGRGGLKNSDPFDFRLNVIEDEPPVVSITNQSMFFLATPGVEVPIKILAEDDLGVRRIDVIRSLTGYRDRILPLPVPDHKTRVETEWSLDLPVLGVLPGEIIEFFVEVHDVNPELIGMTASGIVRVKIISESEYAEMLRQNSTIDDFIQRYETALLQYRKLEKAIQAVNEEVTKEHPDAERLTELLQNAARQNRKTRELFNQLVDDFKIYDAEEHFTAVLKNFVSDLDVVQHYLEKATPDHPTLHLMLATINKKIPMQRQKLEREVGQARTLAALGRVLEMRAEFLEIIDQQSQIVRELNRFETAVETPRVSAILDRAGGDEEALRLRLKQFADELQTRAEALPEEFDQLRRESLIFADAIRSEKLDSLMSECVGACKRTDPPMAAGLARVILKILHSPCSGTGEGEGQRSNMCQTLFLGGGGSGQSLCSRMPDWFMKTIQQMLNSVGRPGSRGTEGQGEGSAGGGLGDLNDGYAVRGGSNRNIPVHGPDRTQFDNPKGTSSRTSGNGEGTGGEGGSDTSTDRVAEVLHSPEREGPDQTRGEKRQTHPKYRDALKRFYSE